MGNMECLIPTFLELNSDQISIINQNSFIIKYKKNETVFKQDMPISNIVFIKSGLIKIIKESDKNKNNILDIISSDNFIGLISSFCKNQYDFTATTLVECEIVFTDIHIFKNIIKENGNYALHIMEKISENGLHILKKLINLSHRQIPGRIAEIILSFSTEIYGSEEFEFPLSRQELADLISTTKESVSRVLSEFNHDKIIEMDEKKIVIKSMELIKKLSRIG
jgi:CRP-like cAMP-binding protein